MQQDRAQQQEHSRESDSSHTLEPHRIPVLFIPEGVSILNGATGKPERNRLPWVVAVVAVIGLLGLVFWFGRGSSLPGPPGIDPYAKYLAFSHIHVSQASNFAGDRNTYLDGTMKNRGDRTVTSITLRVLFATDSGEPAQIEQVPVSVIRSRQLSEETEPISANPLTPDKSIGFRLIFDNISPQWNGREPQLQLVRVETKP